MIKAEIPRNVFIPMPVCIVGTMNNGKPNFMAAGWVSRANASPPMLVVGIGKSHLTHELILRNREFSICFPSKDQLLMTDYTGLVSGKKHDKSDCFHTFSGHLENAPMAEETPICLECRLVVANELPTNTLFVGEIVGAWCNRNLLKGSDPDFAAASAFFLTMPDNTYWSFGEPIGKAWSAGKEIKKTES